MEVPSGRGGAGAAGPAPDPARLSPVAARAIRTAIVLAGGREVCFTCQIDGSGTVVTARAVARGDSSSVLALPGFAKRGEMLVHNHPSGLLEPSGPDLEIAAKMHDDGIGFGIVDNTAERLYVVVEVPQAREVRPLDGDDIAALLGPDGPVATHLGRYEDRPSQRDMAKRIARLYSRGGIGLIEAGTGVGKSLGYLIPALQWAAANGERTVVSTNTITLQEQLVGKDLPFLGEALDQPVRFALLKGWRNYICLLRLDHARTVAGSLFEDAAAADFDAIDAWAARTADGSVADLPIQPRGEVWDEVAAEADLCTRLKCPHFDKCFVFRARRAAAQADVVVVNHHLLMADLAVRRASQNWTDAAVLPSYARLVIDEGHHLEDAASNHLAATASRRGIHRLLSRLERKGRGLLPTLEVRLAQSNDLLSTASRDLVRVRLYGTTSSARRSADRLFDLLEAWMARGSDSQVRLTDAFDDEPVWHEGLSAALDDLLRELDSLSDGLILVRDRIETDEQKAEELGPVLGELRGVIRRLESAGDALRGALRPGADAHERIRWIELRGGNAADAPDADGRERKRHVGVASVPLDLAPILREDLFRRVETCVVTSATLAVGDGFDFIARRLGLDEDDVEPVTAALESPFDFAAQALLAIPTDMPVPAAGDRAHVARTAEVAADLIRAAGGGIFILCTSHRDVREVARLLREQGAEREVGPLLVHGEDGRDALLRRFRAHGDAVLVGTASFWEGVDVPGRALRGLVLARIPFRVPTEPITAAHCEAIAAAGGDAFATYMIPHAALRLKQGFGRLIRSRADRGAVVICDSRVVRKGYGAALLAGLPPARRIEGPWDRIRSEVDAFYRATESRFRG
ncbi:MAG TPA: helicase C-terminal domain-containing protein [Gemmatimonadaceae bacterium]|nr:helicase C-terminal domain-containing protein [Gemmatimonadaceae bacterium]